MHAVFVCPVLSSTPVVGQLAASMEPDRSRLHRLLDLWQIALNCWQDTYWPLTSSKLKGNPTWRIEEQDPNIQHPPHPSWQAYFFPTKHGRFQVSRTNFRSGKINYAQPNDHQNVQVSFLALCKHLPIATPGRFFVAYKRPWALSLCKLPNHCISSYQKRNPTPNTMRKKKHHLGCLIKVLRRKEKGDWKIWEPTGICLSSDSDIHEKMKKDTKQDAMSNTKTGIKMVPYTWHVRRCFRAYCVFWPTHETSQPSSWFALWHGIPRNAKHSFHLSPTVGRAYCNKRSSNLPT